MKVLLDQQEQVYESLIKRLEANTEKIGELESVGEVLHVCKVSGSKLGSWSDTAAVPAIEPVGAMSRGPWAFSVCR